MVLKNEKAPVFLNVNKLEIGLLMNGFPFKHFLNCNNPNRIKKRLFQGHKSFLQSKPIHLKRVFSTGIPTGICDQSIVTGLGSTQTVFVKTNKAGMEVTTQKTNGYW
jgi:hypothetical protein